MIRNKEKDAIIGIKLDDIEKYIGNVNEYSFEYVDNIEEAKVFNYIAALRYKELILRNNENATIYMFDNEKKEIKRVATRQFIDRSRV